MEELIAKFLPEELKERRRLYEEEMEELSKYVHACFCFPFHALQLTETDTLLTSSLFSDIMFLVWNGHGKVIYIMEVSKAPLPSLSEAVVKHLPAGLWRVHQPNHRATWPISALVSACYGKEWIKESLN